MFVSFETTKEMLAYYVSQNGLPFIADSLDGKPVGFIFQQPGGYDVSDLRRVQGEDEMLAIVAG